MAEESKAAEPKDAVAPPAADPAAAGGDSKKKKGSGGEKSVGKFIHGDHMVHILFQKGKKFIPLCEDERTANLIIEVTIGDQTQYSTVKSDVLVNSDTLTVWDEHMFFEFKNLSPQKAKELQISIKILNQGWIKNELVGQAQFDLSSIYFSDNQKIEHQWVALDNPDAEDFENMKGLLKISANCTGPKDNAQKLEPHVGPEPAELKMFMSPSIKRTYYQLTISILEGHNLPEYGGMFTSASLEAYFKLKYMGGNSLKTKVRNQVNKKVGVFQQFLVPVQTPVLQDRLVISAWDYNKVAADTQIGSLILSVKKLIQEGQKPGGFFVWKDLNGSPQDNTNDAADAMNENPELASDWKGNILMHIEAVENDKPQKGVQPINDDKKKPKEDSEESEKEQEEPKPGIKTRAKDEGWYNKDDYEMLIEIGQGITLPWRDTKYKVQVSIQNIDWQCDEPKEKKGEYVRWHSRSEVRQIKLPKNLKSIFTTEDTEYQEELRLYIYLLNESDVPVSYWWGPLSDFQTLDAQWRWIQLKPDRSYGKIEEDYQAGMVSVRIGVARLAQHGNGSINWKSLNAWKKDPPKRVMAYTLRAFIFQCRDLPAADSDGSSDPFIKIFNTGDEEIETDVIEDNVNPIFMECLEVDLDFEDYRKYSDAPPIVMDVLDADEGYISDSADFLGRCKIFLNEMPPEDLVFGSDHIVTPKWYDIKFGTDDNSPACGQILASFTIRQSDDSEVTELDFVPKKMNEMVEKKDFSVFINCLGLRELESIGLLPIQKPFVKFMIKSLTDPRQAGTLSNIQTRPGPYGCNPNINSIIKFTIPLPCDELYCPSLSCTVYDQVFLGFSQPQVGSFTLPLGKLMAEERVEKENWIQNGLWLIERLKARLEDRVIVEDVEIEVANNNNNNEPDITTDHDIDGFLETEQNLLIVENDEDQHKNDPELDITKPTTKLPKKQPSAASKIELARQKSIKKNEEKQARKDAAREAYLTMDSSNNVLVPTYKYDAQLKVYREILVPDSKVFKPVGFNSQDLIKNLKALEAKIPATAALSDEMRAKNPNLAKQLRQEMKRQTTMKLSEQVAVGMKAKVISELNKEEGVSDVEQAAKIMAQIYDKTNKHYRVFFEDELENDKEIFPKGIFYNAPIMRGQSRGVEKSWFSFGGGQQDESGQESTLREVGKFKGVIDIFNKDEQEEYVEEKERLLDEIFSLLQKLHHKRTGEQMQFNLNNVASSGDKANFVVECKRMQLLPVAYNKLTDFLEQVFFDSHIKELLSKNTEAIVHLYCIQAYDLASRDIGSASDPYLIITCGDMVFNEVDNYQNDQPNPKFNKRYDFNVTFPGAPPLVIEAYDYDLLFGDDLIGKTVIDLDDRFFNPKWVSIEEKPVETRELYHKSSMMNQGVLDCWVDIDPAKKTSDVGKVWNIETEPTRKFQIRLSVYSCTGIPMEDWEGTSDVFLKAFISEDDRQETDTHYRNTNGKPSFNYRLLFEVETPTVKPFMLTMQAWDRDLLKSNDLICQWQLDITSIVRDSKLTNQPMHVKQEYYENSLKSRILKEDEPEPFTFPRKKTLEMPGEPTSTLCFTTYSPADPEKKKPINLYVDLRVVPGDYAEQNKVGAARSDPNIEPQLPSPVGRFQLSLNPIAMLNQLCGAALRRKIWCCICCILCLLVLYYVMPLLASFKTLFGD